MFMQKEILYDTVNSKYTGSVDYGNILVENSETPASESLVLCWQVLKSKGNAL